MSCDPDMPEYPGNVDTPEREEDGDPEVHFRGPRHPLDQMDGLRHSLVGRPITPKPEPYDGKEDWQDYLVYFEQLAELNGWDKPTMAMVLGLCLRGAARTVLSGLSLPERRDYRVLKEALTQNFNPPQKVHLYMAELKARKRRPEESLVDLGRDVARLTRLAYPHADTATRETIGINAFLDSMPGPAIEIRLHVIKGHPATLQEAIAYAMEVDVILESQRTSAKRSNVRSVEEAESSSKSELRLMAEALQRLEKRLDGLDKKSQFKRSKAKIKCYQCGKLGHYKSECKGPPKSGNEAGAPSPQ